MDNNSAQNYLNSSSAHLLALISSSQAHDSDDDVVPDTSSRTDLDSNANMAVTGRNCVIVADTGKHQVSCTPEYEAPTEVPIFDAVILYESAINGDTHLLLLRNATSVPTTCRSALWKRHSLD